MFILIDKAGFINKGAELMLRSVADKLKTEFGNEAKLVLASRYKITNEQIRKNGFYQMILPKKSKKKLNILNFIPTSFLNEYGIVSPEQISVVIDAAGFAIGDQWVQEKYNSGCVNFEINHFKELKKYGAKIILLPQAFGPFKKENSKDIMKGIFPYIDLMYARETESYNYLIDLLGENEKIKLAPDFTNLYKPDIHKSVYEIAKDAIVIIPNSKMITHTSEDIANNYMDFLEKTYQVAKNSGKKIVFLNHEGERDKKLIFELYEKYKSEKIYILDDLDANDVKAAIGVAYLVISSRFHGVVSALCQGVPVYCTSWSHKYKLLLQDYDYTDGLLDTNHLEDVEQKLNYLLNSDNNNKLREHLSNYDEAQKKLSEKMWKDIFDLGIHTIKSEVSRQRITEG